MKDTYTKALLELLATTDDVSAVLSGFKKTLKRRGHEQLLVPVLRAVDRTLSAKRAGTTVAVADEAHKAKFRAAIDDTLASLNAEAEPTIVIDETLVGGYIVEHNHQRVDASYKSKLVALYRKMTA